MRNFLQELNIWGAVLLARSSHVMDYSVPCLLQYCNKILLMLDNEDEKTKKRCLEYQEKYPDIIRISYTGLPRATEEQENSPRGLFHRFKPLQSVIREKVFEYLREEHKENKVDILIWPDHDEIFSDSLPQLLKDFWNMPDKKGITMKPVDVFGDFTTIHSRSMTGHGRIFRFFPELTAKNYRTACNYRPLTKQDRLGSNRVLIHLASLKDTRIWRAKHWKPNARGSEALWKLPRDIRTMTPEELRDILHREPDMNIDEYLRGGDKRRPVGVENAKMALRETSDMLDELGVRHYLAFGTALSVHRDNNILKWEWDSDVIVDGEDTNKLITKEAVELINKKGFKDLKIKRDIPKWKTKECMSDEKYIRTISFKKYGVRNDLDPAYISECGTKRIILKGRKREIFSATHPKEWFDNAEIIEFNGKKYLIPSPISDYLESNYGSEWRIPKYGPMPWSKRSCMSQYFKCK